MVFGNLYIHKNFFLVVGFLIQTMASAEIPETRGSVGLQQSLLKLKTRGRVLYVVAHPDDEDAGVLTLLSRGHGLSVTLLSLTRGEAGANLITGDAFDRLGALRTLEHRRAAENYGVDLRYTSFADFGFSKNVKETWKNWDREAILGDVVRVVREVRPHILIARFQGAARDGHGHHIASGLLAREAFAAAADPARFPEAGPPWRTRKLYSGNWREGEPGVLAVDSGQYDPVLGRSYAELGREGYRFQRSQAMGAVLVRPGPFRSYYKRIDREDPGEKFFLDGLEEETAVPARYRESVEAAWREWPRGEVSRRLAEGLRAATEVKDEEWRAKFNAALNLSLGVVLEAAVEPRERPSGMAALFRPALTFRAAAPGEPFAVGTRFHARAGSGVELVRLEASTCDGVQPLDRIVLRCRPTYAHWERASIADTRYRTDSLHALPPAPVVVRAYYRYSGVVGVVEKAPETSQIDAIGLEVREPLVLGPRASVRLSDRVLILRPGVDKVDFEAIVRNESDLATEGVVDLQAPQGWNVEPDRAAFRLTREGEEYRIRFSAKPPGRTVAAAELSVRLSGSGWTWERGFERITYAGLGSLYLAPPARLLVRPVDVRVPPGLKVGYVMGSGDEVPAALRQLGVDVTLLDSAAIAASDLRQFPVILLGIRTYAARPELAVHNQRLLDYVRDGGILIVQYNTQEYDKNFGPYPYSMTARAEEVSEEDAPVTMLDPTARVFQFPNRITASDWEGWFEQRGSKFFTEWDSKWKPLIETHDTGQAPQRGIWLEARHGKGLYVYCSLAWYRQLPMGVPGAWRLMANLVSLGAR